MAMLQLFVVHVEGEPPIQNPQHSGPIYYLSTKKDEWEELPFTEPISMFNLFCKIYGLDESPVNYKITLGGHSNPSGCSMVGPGSRVEMYRV